MNTTNLHAANATSVVGSGLAIPRADGAAVGAAGVGLGQMRAAFKPVVGVAAPLAVAAPPSAASAAVNANAAPNTAGAGALQFTGRWSLDRDDSDSTNDYLEAMGLPLIARQAADKLDLMVIISQTPGEFVITRRTRIFMETKTLKFGEEVNVKGNLITVTGDAAHIRTITQLSQDRGMLTDIRTIDAAGRMRVELTLSRPEHPNVVITRFFKKTSDSTSLENLPAFDITLEQSSDTKRKR